MATGRTEISWEALVRSVDGDTEESQYVYEFGRDGLDGLTVRRFYDSGPSGGVYDPYDYLVDAQGRFILDADGNRIRVR